MKKRLMITGGHLTPALAVADLMLSRGWEVTYVGRLRALENDPALSPEVELVRQRGMQFLPITTGRLQRRISVEAFISLLKIPIGFVQAFLIILKTHPQIILSFGGYIGFPVAVVGKLLGKPVVIHEQTRAPGLANRLLEKVAAKICISWEDSTHFFPTKKTVYTGNPLRKEIYTPQKKYPMQLDKPLLYITGGNTGSHSINLVVEEVLLELLKDYCVIHQCGNSKMYGDFERLSEKMTGLPKNVRHRYLPVEFVEPQNIGWVYNVADLVVSRAGANTVTELIALKKPALFIPLPWARADEQTKNACYLADQGAALMLSQKNLSPQLFLESVKKLAREKGEIQKKLLPISDTLLKDGDERLVRVIESLV